MNILGNVKYRIVESVKHRCDGHACALPILQRRSHWGIIEHTFWANILIGVFLMVCLMAAPAFDQDSPEIMDSKAFQGRLKAALVQAVKEGKTKVDINLDEISGLIQAGDLAEVDFTITLEDGRLYRTTLASVARQYETQEGPGWVDPDMADWGIYSPEPYIAGPAKNPGDISETLIGLKPGDEKRIILEPGKGGLKIDRSKIKTFPRIKTAPRVMTMPVKQYTSMYGKKPVKGDHIQSTPYFTAIVSFVSKDAVTLTADVKGEKTVADTMGQVTVSVNKDTVTIGLDPEPGAYFEMGEEKGRVTSVCKAGFSVDFNPPGTGKNLVMDMKVLSVTKASRLAQSSIHWLNSYDTGLAAMNTKNKPMLLYLYRPGCPWCGHMQADVFPDPMIRDMGDDLVWVKINSEKHKDIKEKFGQQGYPMMVLMNADGTVYRELDGFRNARKLRKEIRLWENDIKAGILVYESPDMDEEADGCRG